MSYRIYENGKALKDLTENHGVQLHDTPADYFPAYMNAAKAALEKNCGENAVLRRSLAVQKDFAAIAVPFWAGRTGLQRSARQSLCRQREVSITDRTGLQRGPPLSVCATPRTGARHTDMQHATAGEDATWPRKYPGELDITDELIAERAREEPGKLPKT